MRSAIKIGGQFSGVGAFDSALDRLGIKYDNIYQAEWDKYARLTYLHNHKSPKYYVEDVNNTPIEEITENYGSLDIAMFSPPCQSFSLAGKRLGKDDKRGILFFNSHEFITKNKPRYFIFENVKGLLSDDSGKTFSEWLHLLGGKSVNGMPIVFPYDGAVPYHVYWKVLNAKDFGVPQNRERVFIIGIRDDVDNDFSFPKEVPLTKRLKDVLESEVDEKYYLSDKMIDWVSKHREKRDSQNDFPLNIDGVSSCVTARYFKMGAEDPYIQETPTLKQVGSLYGSDIITHNMMPRSGDPKKGGTGHLSRTDGIAYCLDTGNTNAVEIVPQSMTKKQLDKFNSIEVDENIAGCITHAIGRAGSSDEYISSIKRNAIITKRIRKLTPRECFRLMDFPDTFMDKIINNKKDLYFQFVYSNFDINKQEQLCNVKLKIVKDTQTPKNLETYVLCTTKECQKMDAMTTLKQKNAQKTGRNESQLNVNFAIELLGELEQKECVTSIIKWTDCMETLYMLMKEGKNQVVMDISETQKESQYTERYLKITLEENLSEEKLFTTLILLKQIMKLKIYTYVKMSPNTQKYISSIINYDEKLGNLNLSFLKMEYTEQLVSNSMLYKQAGNSIVVNVLAQIIKKLKL